MRAPRSLLHSLFLYQSHFLPAFCRAALTSRMWLNEKVMAEYRPKMRPYYYDPAKYNTYLEQLGIKYPTTRVSTPSGGQ